MKWLLKRWVKQLWEALMEVLDEWVTQKELNPKHTNQKRQNQTQTQKENTGISGVTQWKRALTDKEIKQQAHDILKGQK